MPIVIQPYRAQHQTAVKAFNQRLRAATGDPDLVFYETSSPSWLPQVAGSPLFNQYFVAVEDDAVRGAYALKYERFHLLGHGEYPVACYHHPLSEGIINRNYASIGSLLLRDALQRESTLYALGMGGLDRPLAKMLGVMRWHLYTVPFYFRVVNSFRFLRQMNVLRQAPWRRLLMDFAAFSGAGWAANSAAQALKQRQPASSFEIQKVNQFPESVDALWHELKGEYRLASVRDHPTLVRLYPSEDLDLTRLCISRQGKLIAWAVVGERRKDTKFGSLRVGSILDCWAHPEHALAIVGAAAETLERQGMDLIVSNQSHSAWGEALRNCGFFQAPSNFIFATSRQHSTFLKRDFSGAHITRANGDGLPRNF